jgi:hypothetical protein
MVRGILATTSAVAFVFGVHVSAFDGQHGHGGAEHSTQPASHSAHAPVQAGTPKPASTGVHEHSTRAHEHAMNEHGHATSEHSSSKTTTTGTTTLTPVQQKVSTHTQLANKLRSRLPVGTDVVAAAKGFRNLGQFVAAVNVSHNLGIPFSQLKADMVQRHMSLGQSIQDLKPSANSTTEVRRAEDGARRMIGSDDRE